MTWATSFIVNRKDMPRLLHSVCRQLVELIQDSAAALNEDASRHIPVVLTRELEDIEHFVRHGPPLFASDLPAYIDAVKNLSGSGIDDRLHLLEKLLVLMSRLPHDSSFSKRLERFVIDILYKDLPHPPGGYLSFPARECFPTTKMVSYAFRTVDGSHYNPYFASLGQAGTPYARSVPSTKPISSLPDPGVLFDVLLRREQFQSHPGGLSSLFFAFANIIVHTIFHTNPKYSSINDASSYLDLSPLYGSSQEQIDQVRRKDGTGRLWEDVFSDARLLLMPPSVCALLVLFSRNHNYIAEKILNINELGTYSSPSSIHEEAREAQDNEIFERARLVNCGFFMQIILRDYVGAILALVQDGFPWRLSPLETMREISHEISPQGQGNAVSIEFNHLYRWHATVSAQDAKWLEGEFKSLFGEHVDFRSISAVDFKNAVRNWSPKPNVKEWTFDGLQRTASGKFDDGDLARILLNATESSAGAFRARGIPEVLRCVEILAIEQSRSWGTCSLNEFRKFIGLKPYGSFREWNPLPEIHTAAEALYKDIDNLELHVGLQAEEPKKPSAGAGLCPGYTISRAILADAVSLTRGDRFLTIDFTPLNLTTWGYQDCMVNEVDGSYGGMLTRLLFRTLPSSYPVGSVYSHFPFLVPGYMKPRITQLPGRLVDKYTWLRPIPLQDCVMVGTYNDVSQVIVGKENFASVDSDRLRSLTKETLLDRELVNSLLISDNNVLNYATYFSRTTEELIRERSIGIGSGIRHVDIIGDVINMLPIIFIANKLIGVPLKTSDDSMGYREQEMYRMFSDVCNYVLVNSDPAMEWPLRESAAKTADEIIAFIKIELEKQRTRAPLFSVNWTRWFTGAGDEHHSFCAQLLAAGKEKYSVDELACSLFSEIIPSAALYSQLITNVVNFYLDDDQREAREDIVRLTDLRTLDNDTKVLAYINEALRLDPPMLGIHRTTLASTSFGSRRVPAGGQVFASILDANLDVNVFGPDSQKAKYDRQRQSTVLWDIGVNGLLCRQFFETTAPQILRVIFSLRNIRRAPGCAGRINWILEATHDAKRKLFVDSQGHTNLWANSLMVQFEKRSLNQ